MTESSEQGWRLSLDAVDNTVADALRQRKAFLTHGADQSRLPEVWRVRAQTVLGWTRRTHFATVMAGLLARATDESANPLCLQLGDRSIGRYSAASVWQKYYDRAAGEGVSVNGLKRSPFVNGVYDQKKDLERGWANNENSREVDQVVEWMEDLATLDKASAMLALCAFLIEVPDAAQALDGEFTVTHAVDPVALFSAVKAFLDGDAEDGRRAQAFVAACLATVHPDKVDMPRSVNDPSRRAPGDAYANEDGLALFAEAKWKTVSQADLEQFSNEVGARVPGAIAMYAALVNADSRKPVADLESVVTANTKTLTAIYDSPEALLRSALVWSAKPLDEGVTEFLGHFLEYLEHIDVAPATMTKFLEVAQGLGVTFTPAEPPESA